MCLYHSSRPYALRFWVRMYGHIKGRVHGKRHVSAQTLFIKSGRNVLSIKSMSFINVLQNIWPHSISYQFYAVVGPADKDPHSIDMLSNLADYRRYLRSALPPYVFIMQRCMMVTLALQYQSSSACITPAEVSLTAPKCVKCRTTAWQ
jgi:hypothetical protein